LIAALTSLNTSGIVSGHVMLSTRHKIEVMWNEVGSDGAIKPMLHARWASWSILLARSAFDRKPFHSAAVSA
jgi:hypothetical protein